MNPIPSRDELEEMTVEEIKSLCEGYKIDKRRNRHYMIGRLCGIRNCNHGPPKAVDATVSKSRRLLSRAAGKAPEGVSPKQEDDSVPDMSIPAGAVTRSRALAAPSLGTGHPSFAGGSGSRTVRRRTRTDGTAPGVPKAENPEAGRPGLPTNGQEQNAQERRGQVATPEARGSQPHNASSPPPSGAQQATVQVRLHRLEERMETIATIPARDAKVARIPDFRAGIEAAHAENAVLRQRVGELERTNSTLRQRVGGLERTNSTLRERMSTLEDRIYALYAMHNGDGLRDGSDGSGQRQPVRPAIPNTLRGQGVTSTDTHAVKQEDGVAPLGLPAAPMPQPSLSYGPAPKVSAGGKRTRAEADEPSGPELRLPVQKRPRVETERPPVISPHVGPSFMWTNNNSSHSALTSLVADGAPTTPAPGADLDDIDMVSDLERDELVDDHEMGGPDWAGPSNAHTGPSNAGFYSDPPSFPFPSSSSEVPARLLTLQSPPNFAPTAPPSFSGSLQDAGSLWVSPPPPLREGWSGHTDDHSPDSSDGTPHRRKMTLGHLASSRNSEWARK